MANKIKGLTIEIGGETTLLQKSMGDVNKTTKNLKSELRDVERLLKLDPGNTELIAQKQKILADSIGETKDKLDQLKEAEKQVQEQFERGEVSEEQFRALQREVIKTEEELKKLEKTSKDFGTNLTRSLEDAGKKMQDFGDKTSKIGGGLTKGVTAPILAAGGAMIAWAKNSGDVADRLLDLHDITGLSTDSIQEWQHVATVAGVDTEVMTSAVEGLVKKIPQLESEGGKSTEAIKKLGFSYEDLKKASPDEQMDMMIKGLSEMDDPLERNAIGAQLFGGAWKDLAPILGMGSDAIAETREEAHDLGRVLSEDSLQDANDFRIEMDKLTGTVKSAASQIGADLAPMLSEILIPLIKDKIVPAIKDFVDKIKALIDWFRNLSPAIQGLIGKFILIAVAIGPLLMIIGKVISVVGVITSALPALGAAFAILTGPIGLVIAAVAAVIAIGVLLYKNWDKIVEFAKEAFMVMWEFIIDIWDNIKETFTDAIKSLSELAAQIWTAVWDAFKSVWESITSWLSESWDNLVTFIIGFKDKLKTAATIVFTFLWDGLKNVWTLLNTWIDTVWNNLINWIINLKEKFKAAATTIFTFLWDGLKNVWETIITWVSEKFENLKTLIADFKDKFKEAGKAIFTGLWDGLKEIWEKLKTWVIDRVDWIKKKLKEWTSASNEMGNSHSPRGMDGSNRGGLARVPYDGYRAVLHKEERVLTAKESKDYSKGQTNTINHSGTIKVEGVNDGGELTAVVDIVMDQLRREVRMA